MAHRKKSDLPTKICPVCERPFSWRARWKHQWDQIVYCSKTLQRPTLAERQVRVTRR